MSHSKFYALPSTPRAQLIAEFSGYPEHMAVVNDDIAALDAAVAADDGDVNVEFHGHYLDTPLTLAIRLHRDAIVKHLIEIGAKVDEPACDGQTPVCVAAEYGSGITMVLLMRAKVDLSIIFQGRSLCDLAAENPDAIVLALLIRGLPLERDSFDDESSDESIELPVHVAARNKNEQVLKLVLAAGGNSRAMDNFEGYTIAHIAAQNANEKVLAALIAAGNEDLSTPAGGYDWHPIHHAAKNENAAVVRLLIAAGVDVNAVERNGENPLFLACSNPNVEVFDALLAAGAEWRDSDCHGTVCQAAANNPNGIIMRRVIDRGVDVNAFDEFGNSPLLVAAEKGSAKVVSMLLAAGADVHATDSRGRTVTVRACLNKDARVLRLLIDAGAPLGDKLLSLAVRSSNIDAVRVLADAGVDITPTSSMLLDAVSSNACERDGCKMLEFLIRCGANYRTTKRRHIPLPLTACAAGLAVLFAHGVNLNPRSTHSVPDQHFIYHPEIVLTLIAAGVNPARRARFDNDDDMRLVLAMGNGETYRPWREIAWARIRIAERQFQLLQLRAFQVCVALQQLRFPALVSCEILAHAFAPRESLVAFHRVWAIVTTIKHFHDRSRL